MYILETLSIYIALINIKSCKQNSIEHQRDFNNALKIAYLWNFTFSSRPNLVFFFKEQHIYIKGVQNDTLKRSKTQNKDTYMQSKVTVVEKSSPAKV